MSKPPQLETPFNIAVSWLLAFNVALSLAGYPLAGSLAAALDVPSQLASYPFRALSTGLMVMMAVMVAFRGTFTLDPILVVFFIAYGFRLFYDANYAMLPDAAFSGLFYLITVVIPFIGISVARGYFDERRAILAMAFVCGPTIIYLSFSALGLAASSRIEETGRLGFDSLNAVSVGYVALYGLVAITMTVKMARPLVRVFLLFPLILLASYMLILASARGAVVGAVLCLLAVSVRNGRVLAVSAIALVFGYVLFSSAMMDLPIVQRIFSTGTDMSSIERFDRIESSYRFMMDNLIFGYGYIETRYYSFPHNLLLESGLALGLVGFVVMGLLQLRFAQLIWTGLNTNRRFVSMLGIIGLSASWLSTTLWGSTPFWTPLVILIAVASEERIRRRLLVGRAQSFKYLANSLPALPVSGRRLVVPERRQDSGSII